MSRGRKKQTRLCVTTPVHKAEILKIYESSKGELHITPKWNKFHETEGIHNPNLEINYTKCTVHNSDHSTGYTISLEQGRKTEKLRNLTFWECQTIPLLAPLFTRLFANLNHPFFKSKPSAKDITINLGDFDPTNNTLIVQYYVCENEIIEELKLSTPHLAIFRFRKFSVVLACYQIGFAQINEGNSIFPTTASPTLNGKAMIPAMSATPQKPLNMPEFQQYLALYNQRILNDFKERMFRWFEHWPATDTVENRLIVKNIGNDLTFFP